MGRAASHRDRGWERFTDRIIREVNAKSEPVVFMLWGSYAQKKAAFVDTSRHLVLKAPHPSPLSAHSGFFGCRHFSKANAFLESRTACRRSTGRCRRLLQARKSARMETRHLGQPSALPASPDEAVLDYVPNPRAGALYLVRFTAPEFTSLCPVTGQPDFAHLVIDYAPGRHDRRKQEPQAVPRAPSAIIAASTRR